MVRKPLIAVTMRLEIETDRFYLGRDYTEALEALGAVPLHVSLIPNDGYLGEILSRVDGVLLPGSDSDVDPLIYGEQPQPRLKKIVPEKDATDLAVLRLAEGRGLPLLAICFGMQSLNVSRGGTLVQDIESEIAGSLKHEQGRPLARNSHAIRIERGSLLSGLANGGGAAVNSHHHQSVRNVGANLRPTAWAHDGVIEAVEDARAGRFVLGVQWHPELSWRTDPLSESIFRSFIAACGPRE